MLTYLTIITEMPLQEISEVNKNALSQSEEEEGEMGVVSLSPTATAAAIHLLFQTQQQSPPPPLLRGGGGGVFPFPTTRGGGGGGGGAFSISTRTQIYFSQRQRLEFFRVKSVESSSSTIDDDELQDDFSVVPSNVLTAEKEEAKAVLTMFLKQEIGLSNEATAGTMSKSVPFIDHLVARLHSIHKTRYLVGRELTTLEIRDALIPYLEYLCEEHSDSLDDVVENFPNLPDKEHEYSLNAVVETFPNPPEEEREQHISEASPTPLDPKKLRAMARMTEIGTDEQLHPNTLYLLNIGLDMNQIKKMARRCPSITCPGWGRNIRPLVEFLLDLGVPPSDIPNILYKSSRLGNFSLSENIIPSMAYLETLGIDKSKWVKVIKRYPNLLTHSRKKVKATVDYLYELGLSRDRIGKVLTTTPGIVGLSIDDNLRPTAEYFRSMGVNLTYLFGHHPGVFNRSIERQFKPVTEFLLDKGFCIEEIGFMASKFGSIYRYSLTTNLIPKWDFFLTMDYPRAALVKFSHYFGYSLEGRIKPRYTQMKECGGKLSLSKFLTTSDSEFLKFLNRMKMKKMLEAQHDSIQVTFDEDGK